jgi:hypothetical protein
MEISNLKKSTTVCLAVGLILISLVCFGNAIGFKNASQRDYINQRPVGNNVYNYAVIFFGKEKGWENAPFLFCRKNDG